jgi:biotin carboxyl carrier protein
MPFFEIGIGDRTCKVELRREAVDSQHPASTATDQSRWQVHLSDVAPQASSPVARELQVDCVRLNSGILSLVVNGQSYEARIDRVGDILQVHLRGAVYNCSVRDPRSLRSRQRAGQSETGEQKLTASMPGKVVRVLAKPGDAVAAGQGVVVIEAMKMQNEVRAPKEGTVKTLLVREGANVNAGEVLAILE